MKAIVVGQKYNKGVIALLMRAPPEIPIKLVRDKDNKYDKNAIKVTALMFDFTNENLKRFAEDQGVIVDDTITIGHIGRYQAAIIADKWDAAQITSGNFVYSTRSDSVEFQTS